MSHTKIGNPEFTRKTQFLDDFVLIGVTIHPNFPKKCDENTNSLRRFQCIPLAIKSVWLDKKIIDILFELFLRTTSPTQTVSEYSLWETSQHAQRG